MANKLISNPFHLVNAEKEDPIGVLQLRVAETFAVHNSRCQICEAGGQSDEDIFPLLRSGGVTSRLPFLFE